MQIIIKCVCAYAYERETTREEKSCWGRVCQVNGDDDSNKMEILMFMKAIKECVK